MAGDEWQGFYRSGEANTRSIDGSEHVYRLALLIESVDDDTGLVTAVVDLDFDDGQAEYVVSGVRNGCGIIELAPQAGSWLSGHTSNITMHVLTGQLDESGQWFSGQFESDPRCACLGTAPSQHISTHHIGPSCQPTTGQLWCFVSQECPNAYPYEEEQGLRMKF